MVNLLEKLGYHVGDASGNFNKKVNCTDVALVITYFILSLINVLSATPSILVFALNTITIIRLLIKNYTAQCRISSKTKVENEYDATCLTKVHMIKITVEATAMVLLMIVVIIDIAKKSASTAFTFFVIIVLVFTLFENILDIIERLYDAQPKALVTNKGR